MLRKGTKRNLFEKAFWNRVKFGLLSEKAFWNRLGLGPSRESTLGHAKILTPLVKDIGKERFTSMIILS
jgi:hypothetical protein